MNDQCAGITDIPPADIFQKTAELAEKLGADAQCKKEIETLGTHFASSMDAKANLGPISGQVKGQISGGADYMKGRQSGCTPLVIAAQKIISNSKKLQCILQKNSTDSTINISQINSISYKPLPFTESEIIKNNDEITKFLVQNPRNQYIMEMQKQQNEFIEKLLLAGKSIDNIKQYTPEEIGKTWNDALEVLKNSQKRNIVMKNFKINQNIGGKLKIVQQLSTEALAEISDLAKQTAGAVAEAGLSLDLGAGALEPAGKSISDVSIEQNQNLSSSAINAKIQKMSQSISSSNILEIGGPGNVVLENSSVDQNIYLDIVTDMIIQDAISAGLKSQSELSVDAKTVASLQAKVRGVDDMIREQGEANKKAIEANSIGIMSALISLAFFFVFLKYQKDMDPSIKFLIIAVIVICVILALIIFYIFFEALIAYISKTLNIPRPAFESTLNRPLIVYQNLLTSLKCNKILTVKDVLVWDSLDDIRARLEIEKFASNFCSL
jgi:hypothetical protein